MFVKESRDLENLPFVQRKCVALVFDDDKHGGNSVRGKCSMQFEALIKRNEAVAVAVIDEKGRRLARDEAGGTRSVSQGETGVCDCAEHLCNDCSPCGV